MLGGGMRNYATFAAWPVSCAACSAITTANFKQTPLTCLECASGNVLPISDPLQWKGDGHVIERWGDLTLTDGHYRCPKCNKLELRFDTMFGIMWD